MSLKDLCLPDDIVTGYDCPINDFFNPIFPTAKRFDVAVGYFSSAWLRLVAPSFSDFIQNGGKCRWLVSPELSEDDFKAIARWPNKLGNEVREYSSEKLQIILQSLEANTREVLCTLIAHRIIEFKISIPKNISTGMMHAKFGVFEDENGNHICFSGSYNLTANAQSNWEHINIFKDWTELGKRKLDFVERMIESLWCNEDPRFITLEPTIELMEFIKSNSCNAIAEKLCINKTNQIELRDYQNEAIEAWGKNNGRGMYIMATGSGKTITALQTIKKLKDIIVDRKGMRLFVLIVVPFKHLLEQWNEEMKVFGLRGIKCYEGRVTWKDDLMKCLSKLAITNNGELIALVTNATFSTNSFQSIISNIDFNFMLVADEAHNLGSETYLKCLPENATHRLGLTATPERHNDPQGTKGLFDFFGPAVFEFTLKDALERGYLTPYYYYPIVCPMDGDEFNEYSIVMDKIELLKSQKVNYQLTDEYSRLIRERADIISGIRSKFVRFKELISSQKSQAGVCHTLIYSGSRKDADDIRQVEKTTKILGDLSIRTRKFTADESSYDRQQILKLFESKELDAIVAIRCLDEGVDVPATRVAYILASTSNPKEFIQRRGRVLRKAKGKQNAVIYDFLASPPLEYEKYDAMIEKELNRAMEFSELAKNRDECVKIIEEYKLTHKEN